MLSKAYSADGRSCAVTFELPADVQAQSACLCGAFNDWDQMSHPMTRNEGGSFAVTLRLETGRAYRFRYLLDETRWENDWTADRYEPNPFGSDDSIVDLTNPSGAAATT